MSYNFIKKAVIIFIIILFTAPFGVAAQVLTVRARQLIADAGADKQALVNTDVRFVANQSSLFDLENDPNIEFWWNFGDLTEPQAGREVMHRFLEPGDYTVQLVVKTASSQSKDAINVSVMPKAVTLIVGEGQDAFLLANFLNQAKRLGFLVYTINFEESGYDFAVEDRLMSLMLENIEQLKNASLIIGWTKNSVEVNSLIRFGNQFEETNFFKDKSVVIATENIGLTSRRTQALYDSLLPENVLVVAPDLLESVVEGVSKDQLVANIQSKAQGKNFAILGIHSRRNFSQVRFYNFLSHFINSLINKGVSLNTILLILMLPIVATIISTARQIVGIKAFGIYIPTILTLTFVAIGAQAGLLIMGLILIIGTLTRVLLKRLRLLYLPRMAIVITAVSVAILCFLYFSVYLPNYSLVYVSVFPILILIILVEEFIKVQIEQGLRNAFFLTIETIVISLVSFQIVNWSTMRNILLAYPEIIFLSFIINFILGKWVGLRIWEYYRFREVIKAFRIVEKGKK